MSTIWVVLPIQRLEVDRGRLAILPLPRPGRPHLGARTGGGQHSHLPRPLGEVELQRHGLGLPSGHLHPHGHHPRRPVGPLGDQRGLQRHPLDPEPAGRAGDGELEEALVRAGRGGAVGVGAADVRGEANGCGVVELHVEAVAMLGPVPVGHRGGGGGAAGRVAERHGHVDELIELVATTVDQPHAQVAGKGRPVGTDRHPCLLLRRIGRPEQQVAPGPGVGEDPEEVGRRHPAAVEGLQHGRSHGAEPVATGIAIVGEVDVLREEELLADVVGSHRGGRGPVRAGHLHGADHLQQALHGQHVHGQDPLHGGAPRCRPHVGDHAGRLVEARRQVDVAELTVGRQERPVPGHVRIEGGAGGVELQLLGHGEVAEGEGALVDLERRGLQEHARPRPHLGVVGGEHEVARRALEEVGSATGGGDGLVECPLEAVELGRELIAGPGQGREEPGEGPEVEVCDLSLQRRQRLPHRTHRGGARRGIGPRCVEGGGDLVVGGGGRARQGRGGVAELLHRIELATHDGHDAEGRQQRPRHLVVGGGELRGRGAQVPRGDRRGGITGRRGIEQGGGAAAREALHRRDPVEARVGVPGGAEQRVGGPSQPGHDEHPQTPEHDTTPAARRGGRGGHLIDCASPRHQGEHGGRARSQDAPMPAGAGCRLTGPRTGAAVDRAARTGAPCGHTRRTPGRRPAGGAPRSPTSPPAGPSARRRAAGAPGPRPARRPTTPGPAARCRWGGGSGGRGPRCAARRAPPAAAEP